jgi:hypothetical protein
LKAPTIAQRNANERNKDTNTALAGMQKRTQTHKGQTTTPLTTKHPTQSTKPENQPQIKQHVSQSSHKTPHQQWTPKFNKEKPDTYNKTTNQYTAEKAPTETNKSKLIGMSFISHRSNCATVLKNCIVLHIA